MRFAPALAAFDGVSRAGVAGAVAVLVVLAVLVGGVLIAAGLRRRRENEVHSVQGYRRHLQTLGHLQERSSSSVRVLGREGSAGASGLAEEEGDHEGRQASRGGPAGQGRKAGQEADRVEARPDPLPVGAGARRPPAAGWERPGRRAAGSRGPLVFEDDSRLPPVPVPSAPVVPRRRASRLSSLDQVSRHLAGPVAVMVAGVAIVGIIAFVAGRGDHGPRTGAASSTAGTGARDTGSPAPSGTGGSSTRSHRKRTQPTTTTAPVRYSPTAATATAATYVPPAPQYTLVVGASTGNCWISVTSGGSLVLAQTFPPGADQSLSLSGPATVVVGAPSVVKVTLDGAPVVLPSGFQTPFTMTLSPAGPAGAT